MKMDWFLWFVVFVALVVSYTFISGMVAGFYGVSSELSIEVEK
jgi:hypothetical protein